MAVPVLPERFNLADYFLFDRLREGAGSRVAIRFGARMWTYDEVARRARAFGAVLERADVRRGERVLLVLPDVPPFAWVFFGALARGCVIAMANPDSDAEKLAKLVAYTRATAVVTVPRVAETLRGEVLDRIEPDARRELRAVFCVPDAAALTGADDPEEDCALPEGDGLFRSLARELATADADAFRTCATHRDEPAIWLFTSGSTGEPRANVHAHRDFAFNTECYAKATIGYRADDVTISVSRLFFGYATGTNLMFPFAVGATVALFSERPTPESVARAVALYRPTIVTNVPTMLGKLLDHDDALHAAGYPGLDFSSVRFSLSAGEALPEKLLMRWTERFGSDVYDGIGSAETFHIYATNRPGDVRPGSLGRVVDGYELRILPEGAEGPGAAPVPPGEIGVLWVRGQSVSAGYWLDREKSWRVVHGEWCRTGDLFRMDEGGYLYFAGRADELLKVSGQWVSPLEVERCLMAHEAVLLAAVVGFDDGGLVKPKAYVVLRDGVRATDVLKGELRAAVERRLARHKVPRAIEFVEDLPKNDRGKIDRRTLRAREVRA